MKIIAAFIAPSAIETSLNAIGLPARAPPIAPAHLDRQLEFDEAAGAGFRSTVGEDTAVGKAHGIGAATPLLTARVEPTQDIRSPARRN